MKLFRKARLARPALNSHGDLMVQTTGSHGPDISTQRLDDLDRAALRHALSLDPADSPCAIDIGCGLGAQAARLAALGVSVLMVDLVDRRERAEQINALYGNALARAYAGDIRAMPEEELPDAIHLVYSQRTLHYLPFPDAVEVLSRLSRRVVSGGRAFVSVASIDSELSDGYPARDCAVEARFARLASPLAEKHAVLEPLCLYREEEFAGLMERAGFSVFAITRSAFGTLKGEFVVSR